jgi:2-oxoglutarate dehydrogenase E2 component (dihydrolipoamide succinyltransferase)
MSVEIKVPPVGESISEVFIGTWLKAEGDVVDKDESLVELETDKATLEVSATVAGTLGKVLKAEGETAMVGDVIAVIEEGEQVAVPSPGEKAQPEVSVPESTASPIPEAISGVVMPAAQRLLEEHGVGAGEVEPSGPGGRLLKEDVLRYVETVESEPSTPERAAATAVIVEERQEEAVPMSPLRRRIAERLVEAQQTAALLTTFNEADMTGVMELRKTYRDLFEKRYGVRLGFMSFFIKAAIDALGQIPQLNAEIRGTEIVYKNYFDIGVAVSTEKGLVVPVIRNAESLSFAEIELLIADFGKRAQSNKLTLEELQGGTFTISNGGVFGSLLSTPIVNPPQSGVLGMHTIQERPVAVDGQIEIRPMMYLALSYDHRIVDGREAVTFLRRIKEAVESPARMLLEV